ncbi:transcription factor atf21 [Metarhizium rileyi]|uniref:Transcription factor atf21 n=1 Tax=Metarhizium rileyi (strain RCEF 4871) TaxID=1649241 RepID=A0A167BGE1_METRR|nr:transcription factor atf21 [Metarhizium rileyi RCEF 4871]
METICTEHHPNKFFMGDVDCPSWEQEEPWNGYLEPCTPQLSSIFEEASPESSFDGAMTWTDSRERLFYNCGPVSAAVSPSMTTLEAFSSKPRETMQAKPQITPTINPKQATSTSIKRKRRQSQDISKSTTTEESKPKRPCRSRSTSSYSLNVEKKDNNKDKQDIYLERSRVASNKFRERKRSEIAQLETEEYTIEDVNRQLRGMLEALTSEILSLKMQLLQHTDCNCELIQAYINKEAQHFVKSFQGVAKG